MTPAIQEQPKTQADKDREQKDREERDREREREDREKRKTGNPLVEGAKVHLSAGTLLVQTKSGEIQAQPGDIIVSVEGSPGVMSRELYESLGGKYDELLDKTYMDAAIARRRDDGLPEMTDEERSEVEESFKKNAEARSKYAEEKKQREREAEEKPAVLAHSKNAPPTQSPMEQGTIAPNPFLRAPADVMFPAPRTEPTEADKPTESGTPPRTVTTPKTDNPVPPGSSTPGSTSAAVQKEATKK
jgi:hypothetical protein